MHHGRQVGGGPSPCHDALSYRNTEKYSLSLSLQLGLPYTYCMASYTRKMPQHKRKVGKIQVLICFMEPIDVTM